MTIKTIEISAQLTYLTNKDADSQVCMANNQDIRDDFKDVFNFNDLLNHIYGSFIWQNLMTNPDYS